MKKLSFWESLVYYGWVIMTLGGAWAAKIIIKKAIREANGWQYEERASKKSQ